MKFQKFGNVLIKYVGQDEVVAKGGEYKVKTLIIFPDIHRVKLYHADPRAPFDRTIAIIDNMQIEFELPVNEFNSLIDNAINRDLFSKISIN